MPQIFSLSMALLQLAPEENYNRSISHPELTLPPEKPGVLGDWLAEIRQAWHGLVSDFRAPISCTQSRPVRSFRVKLVEDPPRCSTVWTGGCYIHIQGIAVWDVP